MARTKWWSGPRVSRLRGVTAFVVALQAVLAKSHKQHLSPAPPADEPAILRGGSRRPRTLRGGSRRIVGGSPASGDYLWATLISISKLGGRSTTCTGSLISNRWVVTAAHCLLTEDYKGYETAGPGKTIIQFGCVDLAHCKTVDATRYVPHPCYTPSNDQDHDDIALVELAQPVQGIDFALVNGLNGSVSIPDGADVVLAGFGTQQASGRGPHASHLMEVQVQTVSVQVCKDANPYAAYKKYIDFDHVLCTGGVAGKDSCNGDSGADTAQQEMVPNCAKTANGECTHSHIHMHLHMCMPMKCTDDRMNVLSGGPAILWHDDKPWLIGVLSIGEQMTHALWHVPLSSISSPPDPPTRARTSARLTLKVLHCAQDRNSRSTRRTVLWPADTVFTRSAIATRAGSSR